MSFCDMSIRTDNITLKELQIYKTSIKIVVCNHNNYDIDVDDSSNSRKNKLEMIHPIVI